MFSRSHEVQAVWFTVAMMMLGAIALANHRLCRQRMLATKGIRASGMRARRRTIAVPNRVMMNVIVAGQLAAANRLAGHLGRH